MTAGPAPPRAIVWDWDGTLADGWPAIQAGLNAAFDGFGLPHWSLDETKARVRRSLPESFPGLFGPDWRRARDLFYGAVAGQHLDVLREIEGAGALLRAVACRAPMAVVSNKSGVLLRAEAARLGWTPLFRAVIGAGDARADKPDPAPIRLALAACGVPAGPDVWYVGDTALDMEAARRAGCRAVLLGDARHDDGAASGADAAFGDAAALADHLSGLAFHAGMR